MEHSIYMAGIFEPLSNIPNGIRNGERYVYVFNEEMLLLLQDIAEQVRIIKDELLTINWPGKPNKEKP